MRLSRFEEYLRKLFMEGAGATWPFYGMVSHVAVIGSRKTQDLWAADLFPQNIWMYSEYRCSNLLGS